MSDIDFSDFYGLAEDSKSYVSKNELLDVLKKYASGISIFDFMEITNELMEEVKFVQEDYAKKSQPMYIKYLLNRVNEIKNDKNHYGSTIEKNRFLESIDTLKEFYNSDSESVKSKSPLVFVLISLYSTFILEEPIHPVGTVFPGSLEIIKKNNEYFCPVKESNLDSPNAVCKFCISKQLDF